MPPMSPMSWYGGSQLTPTVSTVSPNADSAARAFDSRLACETTTPLGALVDPEVYCRKAVSCASHAGCVQSSSRPSGARSAVASVVLDGYGERLAPSIPTP